MPVDNNEHQRIDDVSTDCISRRRSLNNTLLDLYFTRSRFIRCIECTCEEIISQV